jgi:hypothetical protein
MMPRFLRLLLLPVFALVFLAVVFLVDWVLYVFGEPKSKRKSVEGSE